MNKILIEIFREGYDEEEYNFRIQKYEEIFDANEIEYEWKLESKIVQSNSKNKYDTIMYYLYAIVPDKYTEIIKNVLADEFEGGEL